MSRVLWLVRHGERRDEAEPGWAEDADRPHDPPLTERGRRQAEHVGARLADADIEAIYASPFLRATETAHLIAEQLDLPVFVEHGLSEHLNPDWFDVSPSVLTPRILAERFGTVDRSHKSVVRPNYPESAEEATKRTRRALSRLLGQAPETTLLVGHGVTVESVVSGLTSRSDIVTPCGSITRLTAYPWGWDVDLLGDVEHLGDDATDA